MRRSRLPGSALLGIWNMCQPFHWASTHQMLWDQIIQMKHLLKKKLFKKCHLSALTFMIHTINLLKSLCSFHPPHWQIRIMISHLTCYVSCIQV